MLKVAPGPCNFGTWGPHLGRAGGDFVQAARTDHLPSRSSATESRLPKLPNKLGLKHKLGLMDLTTTLTRVEQKSDPPEQAAASESQGRPACVCVCVCCDMSGVNGSPSLWPIPAETHSGTSLLRRLVEHCCSQCHPRALLQRHTLTRPT